MKKWIHLSLSRQVVILASLLTLAVILVPDRGMAGNPFVCRSNNQGQHQSAWDKLREIFCRQRKKGGTQGEFCSLSPNIAAYITWSDRPRFVWQGTVKRIEIRLANSQSALWSRSVENEQSVLYDGEGEARLQFGREYEYWIEYETTDNQGQIVTNTQYIPFKVMEAEAHQRLQNQLETRRRVNGNESVGQEEQVLDRALFFEENNLFLDVVRELFSVPTPSANWKSQVKSLRNDFCQ